MMNKHAYAQGVTAGMAKFAISRFRQYARNATQTAWNSQDPAASARARAVTQQAYGAPKHLGTGQEGTGTFQMLPQAYAGGALTPTVRKTFDPDARLASPELINRRIALGPTLNETGSTAKYYGHGTNTKGQQYIDSEFIPGKPMTPNDPGLPKAQAKIDRDVRSAGMRTGVGHLSAKDIHSSNIHIDPRTGKPVTFDYMPMKRNEALDARYNKMLGLGPTNVTPTHAGSLLFPNSGTDFQDPTGIHQRNLTRTLTQRATPLPSVKVPGESVFGTLNDNGGTKPGIIPKSLPTAA